METISKLTGLPIQDGCKDVELRKMCYNCIFVSLNKDNELVCTNKENMGASLSQVYKAINEVNGYSVTNLQVEPKPLKKPTNRCGNWKLNVEYLESLFM